MEILSTEVGGTGNNDQWALWIRIKFDRENKNDIKKISEFYNWILENIPQHALHISALDSLDGPNCQDLYIFKKEYAMAFKLRWS